MNSRFSSLKALSCMIMLILSQSLLCTSATSQDLLHSRKTSELTYIYKISDKEAEQVYKHSRIREIDSTFFHTLVDSYPTDSLYKKTLAPGHYIKTYARGGTQDVAITTVQDFNIYILNNNTDLRIQVYDLQGNVIEDARVKVKHKRLRYNKKAKAYIDRKSNKKGLVRVTYNGMTAYYDLSRRVDNSFIKLNVGRVLYSPPVRYVWLPVRFVVKLPIDGVTSIHRGYATGVIYNIVHWFRAPIQSVSNYLDFSFYRNLGSKKAKSYDGYMVFNKPKYLPGDTVKFKAFVLDKNNKTVNDELKVRLNHRGKRIALGTVSPYHDGGYSYQFYLHDSLQLQLDRIYSVELYDKQFRTFIRKSFRYEDYELGQINLSARLANTTHYVGEAMSLFIKGTDVNDLNLLDASVEVLVKAQEPEAFFDQRLFVPDTLFYIEQELAPTGETEIVLAVDSFPSVNMRYAVEVRMRTSDNELKTTTLGCDYFHKVQEFTMDVKLDSIDFAYLKNGNSQEVEAWIYANDNFGNRSLIYNGKLPHTVELDPFVASYSLGTNDYSQSFNMSSAVSKLSCYSYRTGDSISFSVDNPRELPFSYNIYKRNRQKDYGYTDSLQWNEKAHSKKNYFITLNYIWGGKVNENTYEIPLKEKVLNIEVKQPRVVYPGQKAKVDMLVTDVDGEPVEGVDITAYSMTKKFNYQSPVLPYLGDKRKGKKLINNFSTRDVLLGRHSGFDLDYDAWDLLAGIDSIEYYKFLYPGNDFYTYSYVTEDSVTQFAPFVMHEGEMDFVHVVYVDYKPVYFSWTTSEPPYSFPIKPGSHHIKIRTSNREISFKMSFEKGYKHILSLDREMSNELVSIKERENRLSSVEKRTLYCYIVPYNRDNGQSFSYIEGGQQLQMLGTKVGYHTPHWAGPFSDILDFHQKGDYSLRFFHESFFEYTFAPQLIRMKSKDYEDYPVYLSRYNQHQSLHDLVLTQKMLEEEWEKYEDLRRRNKARYGYPHYTTEGFSKLQIERYKDDNNESEDKPLNILVFTQSNRIVEVYPGEAKYIHQLKSGDYKLVFLYKNGLYYTEDSVHVKTNGLNYLKTEKPHELVMGNFDRYLVDIFEDAFFYKTSMDSSKVEPPLPVNNVEPDVDYDGEVITGIVSDEMGGIPGVAVIVEGTDMGVVTNLDGEYSIKIPVDAQRLVYQFIGMNTEYRNIGYNSRIDVVMEANVSAIEELVVIGYGVQKKHSVTGSVSAVNAEALSGIVAGVSVVDDAIDLESANILIRGQGSLGQAPAPLIVIDGEIFTGNIDELDPFLFKNIDVLKDASATSIYGARGANGVLLIDTHAGISLSKVKKDNGADYDAGFFQAASQANSLRDNFSDYAFWQPELVTDENGKVSFEVTFPDDVTSWSTYYLAMNGNQQSGQSGGFIKSYKPLMAQVAVPRFLLEGDSAYAIGKVLNYTSDSIEITASGELNGKEILKTTRYCEHSSIDTLLVQALGDTVKVKYSIITQDDYFDGEQRDIPVFHKGLEEAKGQFYVLDKDSTIAIEADSSLGEVSLYARADEMSILKDELNYLLHYRYSCNEQLASKLKADLAMQRMAVYKDEAIKKSQARKTKKLIKQLKKNRCTSGLWGWWPNSKESLWISIHVLEALLEAESEGYNIALDKATIKHDLLWQIQESHSFYTKLRLLKIAKLLEAEFDYEEHVNALDTLQPKTLNALFHLIELKQQCGLDYDMDTLMVHMDTTLFGNLFFTDEERKLSIIDNDVRNTVIAYRILQADSVDRASTLKLMRNYFFEQRYRGYWRNTYESSSIIDAILPDIKKDGAEYSAPTITLSGDYNEVVEDFPFELKLDPKDELTISKAGTAPVYVTSYQHYWNPAPELKQDDFEIVSYFGDSTGNVLEAGKEIELVTKVKVRSGAEYVMINIPIPGACSYASKKQGYGYEDHREYFKHKTSIFCSRLPKGEYTFRVKLLPRYTGKYTLNPAKIELMYFPTFSANERMKRVSVE